MYINLIFLKLAQHIDMGLVHFMLGTHERMEVGGESHSLDVQGLHMKRKESAFHDF